MAGKTKRKVVLSLLLVVAAGGIVLTTCKPSDPNFSITFVGFTNGPKGQMQAVFDITNHASLHPEWYHVYLIQDSYFHSGFQPLPYQPIGTIGSFQPQVTVDISEFPETLKSFRIGLGVFIPNWKVRVSRNPIVKETIVAMLIEGSIDSFDDNLSFKLFAGPWIRNPNATNQAEPTPPE